LKIKLIENDIMTTLGIDIGSSSVKASLLDVERGECVASASLPEVEMEIKAVKPGWAEQAPTMWWDYACRCIGKIAETHPMGEVKAIGITYQMHGLVCLDAAGNVVRDSIIWCDSRATPYGERAMEALGRERCLDRLLGSPGNFTASKLAWVAENEPENFARTTTFMLPGDYINYMLTGELSTTCGGLSEGMLWDFREGAPARFVAEYYGIRESMLPRAVPSIGIQGRTSRRTEELLGIPEGTPVAYRAGDQPNNAFSLGVLRPGEIAATGGTSGVVYSVVNTPEADPQSRVGTFLHVNHTAADPSYGILLCINGAGILNAWMRRLAAPASSYEEINRLCEGVPAGSDGLCVLPFGNGAERMLCNRATEASIHGIDLNRHTTAHVLRAAQEGIAFAFRYGVDIMRGLGLNPSVIRAGSANLFLSPIFRTTLATLCGVEIELYNTDGSLGAARGAALGAGLLAGHEIFASLRKVGSVGPDNAIAGALEEAYERWKGKV
jgi:xylulokinase